MNRWPCSVSFHRYLLGLLLLSPTGASKSQEVVDHGEIQIYERMEATRLQGIEDQEIEACQVLLERYPTSRYASKAKYRLACIGLRDATDWDSSIDRLLEVEKEYPDTIYAHYARQLHQAYTDPRSAFHLELLVDQYNSTAKSGAQGGVEKHTLSESFTIHRLLSFYDQLPLLKLIEESKDLNRNEKAQLAYKLARIMYRAPLRDRDKDCETVCLWIIDHFPRESTVCDMTFTLLGELHMKRFGDLNRSEDYIRRIGSDRHLGQLAGDSLCSLAHFHYMNGDLEKAYGILNEVRRRWPSNRCAWKAYGILTRREFVENYGVPILSDAERAWAEYEANSSRKIVDSTIHPLTALNQGTLVQANQLSGTAPFPNSSQSSPTTAEGDQLSPLNCGAVALQLVCERLSISCTSDEAYELCPPRNDGTNTFFDLYQACLKKGLRIHAMEMNLEYLKKQAKDPGSAIILHMPNHFSVIRDVGADFVSLEDSGGITTMNFTRLGYYWDGYAMVAWREASIEQEAQSFAQFNQHSFLTRLAERYQAQGMVVEQMQLDVTQLARLARSRPDAQIVVDLPTHFVVLKSIEEKGIRVEDVDGASSLMSIEDLGEFWDGQVIVLKQAPLNGYSSEKMDDSGQAKIESYLDLSSLFYTEDLKTRKVMMDMRQLKQLVQEQPIALILRNPNRVMSLKAVDDQSVILSDTLDEYRVSLERLQMLWNGRVLIIHDGDDE